mgnify:CR=1 FL=1
MKRSYSPPTEVIYCIIRANSTIRAVEKYCNFDRIIIQSKRPGNSPIQDEMSSPCYPAWRRQWEEKI